MTRSSALALAAVLLGVGLAAQEAPGGQDPVVVTPQFDPAKFVEWLRSRNADAKILETFQAEWKQGADGRVTDRAVRLADDGYRTAMELIDDGDPRGVLDLTKLLSRAKDPVIRAHARYFLSRALLDEDDPEGASELLKDFIRYDRGLTSLDGEAAFYLGYSLSLIPKVEDAIINLDAFLQLYPDAAERYRANADQLLQELKAQWRSPLHAIADEMKFCERRLKKDRAGEEVETKQLEILEKLQQLIEQLEQQQQAGGGSPKGNTIPNAPAGNSALPGGEGRVGQLHGSRGVKDKWGNMPDKDRQAILNELQTKLPERYRVLLENYYKRINKPDR